MIRRVGGYDRVVFLLFLLPFLLAGRIGRAGRAIIVGLAVALLSSSELRLSVFSLDTTAGELTLGDTFSSM